MIIRIKVTLLLLVLVFFLLLLLVFFFLLLLAARASAAARGVSISLLACETRVLALCSPETELEFCFRVGICGVF